MKPEWDISLVFKPPSRLTCFCGFTIRVKELRENEASEETELMKAAGNMVKAAAGDPKLASTNFMKFVSDLASDPSAKAETWTNEFMQVSNEFMLVSSEFT